MTLPFVHLLYERVLAADCEVPFLPAAPPQRQPDLTLQLTSPSGSLTGASWHHGEGLVLEKTAGGDVVMRFADSTEFLVQRAGRAISLLVAPSDYTRDDLLAYALGPVLTIALHLQGAVLLHAAAALLAGKALLFAGPSGSGKSTTAAMLHRLGYAILSDDVVELRGESALASLPAVRLWPDVLETLYGSAAAFPDHAPSWDKKILRTKDGPPGAHPIAAVLFLDAPGATQLQRMDARAGWQRLIADAPTARIPDPFMEQRIFEATSALADRVPMFAFSAPPLTGANTLGEFLETELRLWLR